ncbi:MAG: cation:proton antiporter [Thermoplasmata archaeon]|nr:Na+/H+ antiporter subunit E [Thermoplasmata archaeon]RLF29547.1 MAG: cation:proton antiporter [Thermoplasmata archaeon]
MKKFIVATVIGFLVYLLLTTSSGNDFFIWSYSEIVVGIIFAIIVGIIVRNVFIKDNFRMLNPVRWLVLLVYLIGPFFISMARANLDVAYRVITGRINPGIVKIDPKLKTDLGVTMLANSITLTPGTLSVDVDEDKNQLYIHWINVKEDALKKKPRDCKYVCGGFPKWVRRIAE